jgi:hypothetical protein
MTKPICSRSAAPWVDYVTAAFNVGFDFLICLRLSYIAASLQSIMLVRSFSKRLKQGGLSVEPSALNSLVICCFFVKTTSLFTWIGWCKFYFRQSTSCLKGLLYGLRSFNNSKADSGERPLLVVIRYSASNTITRSGSAATMHSVPRFYLNTGSTYSLIFWYAWSKSDACMFS